MSLEGAKTFLVITGASRGFGQAAAIHFAKKVATKGSVFLLVARSSDGLKETKKLVLEQVPGLKVKLAAMDLGKPDKEDYKKIIIDAMNMAFVKRSPSDFDHAAIIHNAGAFQHPRCQDLDNMKIINEDYITNVASFIILNSQFFEIFKKGVTPNRTLVQISSGLALSPIPTCGLYGPAKSARDNFVKVFSLEFPDVQVLSYAPGVMDTLLYREMFEQMGMDVDMHIRETTEAGIMLTALQSVEIMWDLLEQKKYVNGSHVDAYGDEQVQKYTMLGQMTQKHIQMIIQ